MQQVKIWLSDPVNAAFAAELGVRTGLEIVLVVIGVGFVVGVFVRAGVELVLHKIHRVH